MRQEIKVVIADHQPISRDTIRAYLASHPNITVLRECANRSEVVSAINETEPDLLFLEIELPGFTGFELLNDMDIDAMPLIIFVTTSGRYALNAFDADAVDYLLKPFNKSRFDSAVKKAVKFRLGQNIQKSHETIQYLIRHYDNLKTINPYDKKYISRILVKERKKYFFVHSEEIYWFEASGDYVILHTEKNKHWLNESLTSLELKLDPSEFIRIHRSSIMNINYISNLQPYFNGEFHITMKNNDKLKLSRNYREKIKPLFTGVTL